ncbi:MAG: radical SAM protein [Clostridia bacterium]|nr:radical SAM protein [Clostridia bacterium]
MFNFISKLSHFPDKAQICTEDCVGRSLSTVFIDLVSGVCNHNCIFCDGKYLPLENRMFSSERLLKMADELSALGVDSAIIVGEGGESTLHPAFCDFAERLLAAGIHVGLYTNGETLCGAVAATASKFDFVRVSLDSGKSETHNVVHRSNNSNAFERITAQLGEFSAVKKGRLGVSYVVLPENVDDIPVAARICEEKGVDFFELKPFYSPEYTFDIPMYRTLADKLDKYYKETSSSCVRMKVVLNNQFAEWLRFGFAPRDLTRLSDGRPCLTSKLRMVISPNGCFLCTCFRNNDEYNLGDPNERSLEDIWYGEKHRELLSRPCCLKCTYHEQNEFLLRLRDGS